MKFRLSAALTTLLALSTSSAFAQQFPTIYVPKPTGVITDLGKLISSIFSALLTIAGLLAFFYLLLGGIQWITSGGDKAGLEAARNKIIHAIVGLIVVFSAWAITLLLQSFLNITILGPISIQPPF